MACVTSRTASLNAGMQFWISLTTILDAGEQFSTVWKWGVSPEHSARPIRVRPRNPSVLVRFGVPETVSWLHTQLVPRVVAPWTGREWARLCAVSCRLVVVWVWRAIGEIKAERRLFCPMGLLPLRVGRFFDGYKGVVLWIGAGFRAARRVCGV